MLSFIYQKETIKIITDLFASVCGFSLYSLVPEVVDSGIALSTVHDLVELVQLLAGIAGVIYLIVRIADLYYSFNNRKISNKIENDTKEVDHKIRIEELRKLERDNFNTKWGNEFLKDK